MAEHLALDAWAVDRLVERNGGLPVEQVMMLSLVRSVIRRSPSPSSSFSARPARLSDPVDGTAVPDGQPYSGCTRTPSATTPLVLLAVARGSISPTGRFLTAARVGQSPVTRPAVPEPPMDPSGPGSRNAPGTTVQSRAVRPRRIGQSHRRSSQSNRASAAGHGATFHGEHQHRHA